jgi:hypothetical protein
MNLTTIYINNNPPNPVILQTPTLQDITPNSITLNWNQNEDEDFIQYQILLSETQGIPGNIIHNITDWTKISHTINNLESNETNFFTIRVIDYSSLSADSNQIQTPTTPIPEFKPIILLPLFLITTLIVLVNKNKLK